ncbi:MAG: HlyC/CorC family transporter [Candidatus Omnitrophica bacterium]|nr:HlyC/CorC family transporter [Candidatus Omnitrophota bacterium]
MLFNTVLLLLFIICSAFFSASETAIFSLRKGEVRRLKEKYPAARNLTVIFRKPDFFLSTIVFGNMLVNIALASLTTAIFVTLWHDRGIYLSILFSGTVILLFGEIIPKTFAIYTYERFSLAAAPVLIFISRLFSVPIHFLRKLVYLISRGFLGRKKEKIDEDEEVKNALILGRRDGYITEAEEEMIGNILEFKDTWVSEIMTPRVDVEGIDIQAQRQEILDILKTERRSKFPVYRESLDNIVGVIYARDVFLYPDEDWHDFRRDPVFVPESKKIDDLLKIFLERNEHIAIVLDEYGGTSGIVTLEDIEEEIFGEIYDEFEVASKVIDEIGKDTWRVYGKLPMKTFNNALELEFPEESDTVAGFILSQMEKIPHAGEKLTYRGVEFIIERATAKRIVSIVVRVTR